MCGGTVQQLIAKRSSVFITLSLPEIGFSPLNDREPKITATAILSITKFTCFQKKISVLFRGKLHGLSTTGVKVDGKEDSVHPASQNARLRHFSLPQWPIYP